MTQGFKNSIGTTCARLLLGATAALAMAGSLHAEELVVGSWGGVWDDTVKKAVVDPLVAETGATVSFIPGQSPDQYAKLIASPDAPPFDVLYIDLDVASAGFAQGLFRPLDPARIPNLARVYPNAIFGNGQAVAASFGAISIVYDEAQIPTVDSWEVFKDPANSGKFAFNSINTWMSYLLPIFAVMDGKPATDFDAGLDALKAVAPSAAFSNGDFELRNSFASGEIAFAPMYSGEAYVMHLDGMESVRLAKPKEGMVAVPNLLVIPANAKNPELAEKFINKALEPSAQLIFAEQYASAPSVTGIELKPELAPWMATGAQEVGALVNIDWSAFNPKRDAVIQRWNTEIAPLIGTK